jgi:hypothetical protein
VRLTGVAGDGERRDPDDECSEAERQRTEPPGACHIAAARAARDDGGKVGLRDGLLVGEAFGVGEEQGE